MPKAISASWREKMGKLRYAKVRKIWGPCLMNVGKLEGNKRQGRLWS
jgi:hypothetical protein